MKVSKYRGEVNSIINQLDITDIYRLLHLRADDIFFSSSHGRNTDQNRPHSWIYTFLYILFLITFDTYFQFTAETVQLRLGLKPMGWDSNPVKKKNPDWDLNLLSFFFFGYIYGIWKFPAQGLNPEPQLQPIPQLRQCQILNPLHQARD